MKKNQCETQYAWWLNDSVQSVILTGIVQHLLRNSRIKKIREINEKSLENTQIGLPPYGILYGHRKLYNGYTFIPLDIMAEFAIKAGLPIDTNYFIAKDWLIPSDLMNVHHGILKYKDAIVNLKDNVLKEEKKDISDKKNRDGVFDETIGFVEDVFTSNKKKKYIRKSKKITYKKYINEKDLFLLRNKYLHWSAKSDKFGLEPVSRSENFDGKRVKFDG